MKLKKRVAPFAYSFLKLLVFDIVSSVLLLLCTKALELFSDLLLGLSGKASISSGNFTFVFTTWQGWLLLLTGAAVLLIYIAVELNAMMLYCGQIIDGKKTSMLRCFRDGFLALRKYLNPRGLIVIVYAVLLSPIIGIGFSISLTRSFYIPRFISSVIYNNPFYLTGSVVLLLFLAVICFIYCFILHGVLLNGQKMKESSPASRKLMKKHWKNFLWETIRFELTYIIITAIVIAAIVAVPFFVVNMLPIGEAAQKFFGVFFSLIMMVLLIINQAVFSQFLAMKTIILYRRYTSEGEWEFKPVKKNKKAPVIVGIAVLLVLITGASALITPAFDYVFPNEIKPGTVAHRAGGNAAPENTAKGITTAYSLGASGSEIDIQRTSDGHYVVNHDDTFERVAGVAKKPYEMTLAEVKKLRVDGEPVSTFEETLEASRDKVTLFVELKGATADERMADDAVRIIREMGMEKQTVLISLKYDVLEYIEKKYPEMDTGYLMFFSFGRIEDNPFDYLALEEEIATDYTVSAIHEKGKKVMVWTVNEDFAIHDFLLSDADMLITDEVKLVNEIREGLSNRTPFNRIRDTLFGHLF